MLRDDYVRKGIQDLNIFELLDLEGKLATILKRRFVHKKEERKLFEIYRCVVQRLGEYALKDPLTQLLNRLAYDVLIGELVQESLESRLEDFSHLILDVDNFKEINDLWGHEIGDKVLKHLGEIILEILKRPSYRKSYAAILRQENPIRLGGEEIVILFPNTPVREGFMKSEFIRKEIETSFKEVEKFPNVTVSGGIVSFTVSSNVLNLGYSVILPNKIKRAIYVFSDFALYKAKKQGKNKILDFSQALVSKLTPRDKKLLGEFLEAAVLYRRNLK